MHFQRRNAFQNAKIIYFQRQNAFQNAKIIYFFQKKIINKKYVYAYTT